MKVSEALRNSFKEQFGIANESYEAGILLDSLIMTTEEIASICKDKNNGLIERDTATEKSKILREKAKRIMMDLDKMTKRVS